MEKVSTKKKRKKIQNQSSHTKKKQKKKTHKKVRAHRTETWAGHRRPISSACKKPIFWHTHPLIVIIKTNKERKKKHSYNCMVTMGIGMGVRRDSVFLK